MPQGYTKLSKFVGVNLTDPPTEIADNELAWARNCWGGKQGFIGPRLAQNYVGATSNIISGSELLDADLLTTLYDFIDKNGAHHAVAHIPVYNDTSFADYRGRDSSFVLGDSAYNFRTTETIYRPNGSLQGPLALSRPTALRYNNELFLFLGNSVPGLVLGVDDLTNGPGGKPKFRELGTTWAAFTGATGDRHQFGFGEIYRDTFMLGGLPPPYESLAFFTQGVDNGGGEQPSWYTLLTSAKSSAFGYGDGDRLLRFMTTPILGGASAVEPYVLGFKQRSVWMLQGDVPTTTDDGTCVVTPVQRREGLVSSHAVCATPYGIIWCSGRNVWLMPPGQQPEPIGNKIQGFLEKLPQTPSPAWFMEYHDDVLYLSFPVLDGVVKNAAGLLLFPKVQQMWCDLRKPDEPKWWGPQDVRASHMLSMHQADGARQLLGMTTQSFVDGGMNTYIGPRAFELAATTSNGHDLGDGGELAGPYSPKQEIHFREMDFGDDSLEKIIDAVEVNASWDIQLGALATALASDYPLTMKYLANGGRKSVDSSTSSAVDTTGTVANPNTGAARSDPKDATDAVHTFSGLAWDSRLPPRNAGIEFEADWDGGTVTITGTGPDDAALVVVVTKSTPAGVPVTDLTGFNYFKTITSVVKSIQGLENENATLVEGDSMQIRFPETDPAVTGFVLDHNTLEGVNDANLAETYIPLTYFPPNSSRFLARSFQPRISSVGVNIIASPATGDDVAWRKITVKSVTIRVRPIGRRPGGSYGG